MEAKLLIGNKLNVILFIAFASVNVFLKDNISYVAFWTIEILIAVAAIINNIFFYKSLDAEDSRKYLLNLLLPLAIIAVVLIIMLLK
ncbi:MAG: hypothetical protein IPK91_02585 [Saprospiraceae bacterium]|nr:hypothetical protein [Saprospiraceae bacterium]MBK8296176.1 hypothetical protein [Saprospiraceae bacterium]